MKRRKEFHLFPLGILLFTLTLTIVSGRIAIHAADLNTELPANDSTEISSEIPTETPVVPSTENPKPVLQGLIHDKNGHFYFYQNGKKLKNRWKKVGKNKYYFGKNGQAVTGKKNISHYLCYFNKKGVPLPHFLWWAAAYQLTPKPYRRLMATGVRLAITLMITKF